MKKFSCHKVANLEISPIEKYLGAGRPRQDAPKNIVGYQLNATVMRDEEKIESELSTKGRFIIATNQLNGQDFAAILRSYKQQQNVEQGFRFLKDPWFMADTMFLKSPRRLEALMMVMTLCLMIYNVAQYRMREALSAQNERLPNQLGKQTSTPTLRWVFQMLEGIILVVESGVGTGIRALFFNLDTLRLKIIRLFGPRACEIYGTT